MITRALAAGLLLVMAACSSNPTPTATPATSATATTAAPTTVPATTPAPQPLTAAAVVAKLKAAGLPIGQVVVYTETTDPNHLLGRPGQYTSKATFTDKRISTADTGAGPHLGDIELGGSVEAFGSPGDASNRADYIRSVSQGGSMFAEYDYLRDTTLLRVSNYLTPSRAARYQTVLAAF